MPIYEFYCPACNVIFNFFSSRINTTARPDCPQCSRPELERMVSRFATLRKQKGGEDGDEDVLAGIDESKMEKAFESLMREADAINEDDPRQMASLMRRFSDQTGLQLGGPMEEAIARMEAGEDPDQIEKEMGDLLGDDTLSLESLQKKGAKGRGKPVQDEKLYML